MTSLPYQPVPTVHQRRELERLLVADHAKRYPIRQYRDVQDAEFDEAVAEFHAARLRYELSRLDQQPEPANFCAVEEEVPQKALREDFVITVIGVSALVLLAINFAWGIA